MLTTVKEQRTPLFVYINTSGAGGYSLVSSEGGRDCRLQLEQFGDGGLVESILKEQIYELWQFISGHKSLISSLGVL